MVSSLMPHSDHDVVMRAEIESLIGEPAAPGLDHAKWPPGETGAILHDVKVRRNLTGQYLVFGLDWSPLVGGEPDQLGLQRARALGATHYVLAGSHASTLGAVRLDAAMLKIKGPLHSAAAIFARKFSTGAVAYLLSDTEGGCWMIACHAGSVLSQTDRWYRSESQALSALEQIRSRFPALQLHIERELSAQGMPSWLDEVLCKHSRLEIVQRFGSQYGRPFKILMGLISVGCVAYFYVESRTPVIEPQAIETGAAWRQALLEKSRNHTFHTYPHLQALVQTWQQIPLRPSGWQLKKIQCDSALFNWQCSAHFFRQNRWALNQHLAGVKPAGWTIRFTPLDEAAFIWQVPSAASALNLSEHWMIHDWMSYLQSIGPVFEHIQVGTSAHLSIQAPVDDQGQVLLRPNEIPEWKQRTLALKGPLRSISTLSGLYMPVRWRRVILEIDDVRELGARQSSLSLQLIGDMFESRSE